MGYSTHDRIPGRVGHADYPPGEGGKVMNNNARVMLTALVATENESTLKTVKALLTGVPPDWAPPLSDVEELATTGRLGGMVQAIMTGDLREAWGMADLKNQKALAPVIPEAYRRF